MAQRARLTPPRPQQGEWPWHKAEWKALPASLLMGGDRRMEAENYLAGGYGIRLSIEALKAGWTRLVDVAQVWQPSRLKGIQVNPAYGTPFLAATQLYDLRPIPRKWLSLDRTESAAERFVSSGMIVVTCSGSVGRATLAHRPHEKVLISHDLLRVEPRHQSHWGWLYAFLRSPQGRAMMSAAQYGHIIKHLEVGHLNALPVPMVRDSLLVDFAAQVQAILNARNSAHDLFEQAETLFENAVGALSLPGLGTTGFSVRASDLFSGRRRLEAFFHNPTPAALRQHFATRGLAATSLEDGGFDIWLPTRFRRIPAEAGVEFMDSSDLFEISPDITKKIADGNFGDPYAARVRAGWLLLARSGQIYGLNGSLVIANEAHEGRVISDHIMRIAPNASQSIRTGYVYVALSHPTLGRPLVKALAYGSSIPEIDPTDMRRLKVVRIGKKTEERIADLADEASHCLASADLLEVKLASHAGRLIDAFVAGDTTSFVL